MAKSKAKKTVSFSLTGELTISNLIPEGALTITEYLDDQVLTYDVVQLMRDNEMNGDTISLAFKGDQGIEPSEEE